MSSDEQNAHPISQDQPPIPKEIWALGIAVFFVNLAAVMVRGFTAIYMKTLGVSAGWIATIDGFNEAISFLMKMLSGVYSDYLRRRKLIIVLGYGFMLVSRPIFALASSIYEIVPARILERLGNGIQASPRDALVGDFAPTSIRGACYGLKNSLATGGSFVGAAVGLILMFYSDNYKMVFWAAVIPAGIAVLIMQFCVKEPEQNLHPVDHKPRHPIHLRDLPRLGQQFWWLMVVVGIFMVAQLGEWIMILHAHETFGLSGKLTPLVMIVYNLTYSSISYPAGRLSDKIGRYNMLAIGFVFLLLGDLFQALATNVYFVFIGIAFCGAQMAVTQSIFMSLVADSVPKDLRGTGFGVFYLICAIAVFVSNSTLGHISDAYGKETSFFISMGVTLFSLLFLFAIKPSREKENELKDNELKG
jgi:MFS family permease